MFCKAQFAKHALLFAKHAFANNKIIAIMNNDGYLHTLQLDDDSESFMMLMMLTAKADRQVRWNHERIDWKQHLEKLRHTNGFQKRYHMSKRSFNQLVNIL